VAVISVPGLVGEHEFGEFLLLRIQLVTCGVGLWISSGFRILWVYQVSQVTWENTDGVNFLSCVYHIGGDIEFVIFK